MLISWMEVFCGWKVSANSVVDECVWLCVLFFMFVHLHCVSVFFCKSSCLYLRCVSQYTRVVFCVSLCLCLCVLYVWVFVYTQCPGLGYVQSTCRMWRPCLCVCVAHRCCAPASQILLRAIGLHPSIKPGNRVTDSFPPLPEKLRDPDKQSLDSDVKTILVLEKKTKSVGRKGSFKDMLQCLCATPTLSPRHYVCIVLICFAKSI